MAERKRSKDGKSETNQYREDGTGGGGGAHSGRSGGNLARDIGTEDALKRGQEDRRGTTRVKKSDEHQHSEAKDSKR